MNIPEALEDLAHVSDILAEYEGETPSEKAEAAVAEVTWLKGQLAETQSLAYAAQSEAKLLRALVKRCREVLETNDPLNARMLFGPSEDAQTLAKRGIVL